MIMASCLFAVMAALIQLSHAYDKDLSVIAASSIRILFNFIFIVIWGVVFYSPRDLIGDGRKSLWLRGFFGSMSLLLAFSAIRLVGMGEASFLTSSNGIFIALMSPFLLGQPNSWKAWVAILGAFAGIYLIGQPRLHDADPMGRIYGVAAGLCSAFAYMMIAKAGKSNKPITVIFYFTLVGSLLHLVLIATQDISWPSSPVVWTFLFLGAAAATLAQSLMTRSYQLAPATLVAATGYSQPVISFLMSIYFFQMIPDLNSWIGAALVLLCGVVLPFANSRATKVRIPNAD